MENDAAAIVDDVAGSVRNFDAVARRYGVPSVDIDAFAPGIAQWVAKLSSPSTHGPKRA